MWLGRVQGHGPPPKGSKASAGNEEDPAEETAEGHGNEQRHKHGKTGPSNTVHSPVLVMAKTQGRPNAL